LKIANQCGQSLEPLWNIPEDGGSDARAVTAPATLRLVEQAWLIKASKGK